MTCENMRHENAVGVRTRLRPTRLTVQPCCQQHLVYTRRGTRWLLVPREALDGSEPSSRFVGV